MYINEKCNKKKRLQILSVTLLLLMVCSSPLSAAVLFEHTGSTDPTTEGWSIGGSGTPGSNGVYTGPITNDAGSGMDAWYVNDTATFGGSNQSYYGSLTSDQVTQASTNGWTLSTTIRIPDASETAAYAPFALYRDGVRSWDVAFGSTSGGDPIVKLITGGLHPNYNGPSYTLQGVGSTYHTYDLVYDPLSSSADLFVDGVEVISDYLGIVYSTIKTNIGWGSGSSIDTGQGNFNAVSFSINPAPVPIPAAVWLFGSGLLVLVGYSKRRMSA
jgi:hypothetical protein